MTNESKHAISVFYSYADEDKNLRDQLNKHLALMDHQNLIVGWHDRDIQAGTEYQHEIDEHLNTAQIILLLISSDFLASDYKYSIEMQRALERHNSGDAYVIPIILRPCDFKDAPFSDLELLPSGGKPVINWQNADDAFSDIAQGIRKVVQEISTKTKEQWLEEGHRYHSGKAYARALVAYERALRLDPNYAQAQRNKGDALYDLKRYEEALDAYNAALHLEAGSARVHSNVGDILLRLKRYDESLSAYDHAIQLAPMAANLYNDKGNVLYALKRYEESLALYNRATTLDPHFTSAYNNKGNALLRLQRYREAIAAYEHAIQLDATFAIPHNNKGRALFYLGRYREALTAYDRAIQLDPRFISAYNNRADALERLSRTQEAETMRVKAKQLQQSKQL